MGIPPVWRAYLAPETDSSEPWLDMYAALEGALRLRDGFVESPITAEQSSVFRALKVVSFAAPFGDVTGFCRAFETSYSWLHENSRAPDLFVPAFERVYGTESTQASVVRDAVALTREAMANDAPGPENRDSRDRDSHANLGSKLEALWAGYRGGDSDNHDERFAAWLFDQEQVFEELPCPAWWPAWAEAPRWSANAGEELATREAVETMVDETATFDTRDGGATIQFGGIGGAVTHLEHGDLYIDLVSFFREEGEVRHVQERRLLLVPQLAQWPVLRVRRYINAWRRALREQAICPKLAVVTALHDDGWCFPEVLTETALEDEEDFYRALSQPNRLGWWRNVAVAEPTRPSVISRLRRRFGRLFDRSEP